MYIIAIIELTIQVFRQEMMRVFNPFQGSYRIFNIDGDIRC